MKQDKTEPRPITAQVSHYATPYGVDQRGKEHYQRYTHEIVSDNERTTAVGCYRAVPTCRD